MMRKYLLTIVILLVSFIFRAAIAQENAPIIIPEQLQRLALKFPVAARLKIDWKEAGADDVGRYLGFLAAVNEVALTLAQSHDRKEPGEVDFLAALSIQCVWPNNKPPLVEQSWPFQEAAFYNATVREAIRKAVGPTAKEIPDRIQKLGESGYAASIGELPTEPDQYYKYVFDAQGLSGGK